MPTAQCLEPSVKNFYIRGWMEICFESLLVDTVAHAIWLPISTYGVALLVLWASTGNCISDSSLIDLHREQLSLPPPHLLELPSQCSVVCRLVVRCPWTSCSSANREFQNVDHGPNCRFRPFCLLHLALIYLNNLESTRLPFLCCCWTCLWKMTARSSMWFCNLQAVCL